MRQYALLDMVLEFKYLPLADLGLSGEQVRAQPREELAAFPAVQTALQEARQQLQQYREVLVEKYREPLRMMFTEKADHFLMPISQERLSSLFYVG